MNKIAILFFATVSFTALAFPYPNPQPLFKDSENRIWAKLNSFKLEQLEAKSYCKKHKMELPLKSTVERLESEINHLSAIGKLDDWFWTSSSYREYAWAVFVYDKGRGLGYQKHTNIGRAFPVLCVSQK